MLLPCCNIHTCLVADVIALVDVITILCVLFLLLRLMFLPHIWLIACVNKQGDVELVDGKPLFCGRCFKPLRLMLLPLFLYMLGWCYCLLLFFGRCYAIWSVMVFLSWQMLLPSGWWNYHYIIIHGWCYCQVTDGIVTNEVLGCCYCQVADGMPPQGGCWQML